MSVNKTKSTIIATVVITTLFVGGYLAYKKFLLPKSAKVTYLIQNGFVTGDFNALMGLDDNYINDWYHGAKKKNDTFMSAGKTFLTKGGIAKQ